MRGVAELLWAFVQRDLTVRYRHALLGIAWAILTPLCQMLLFTAVFSRLLRVDTGLPYPVYAFCGLVVWTLTASGLRGAITSLSANAHLVTKVAFRREVLPLAPVVVATVDFLVALAMVALIMAYYGLSLPPTVLLLPVVLVVQLAFTSGLALLLSAANLLWHDVHHVFEIGITLWMFASAVLYPLPALGGLTGAVLALNPMTPLIDAYRDILVRGTVPDGTTAAVTAVSALLTLIGGLVAFQRAEPRFAELA